MKIVILLLHRILATKRREIFDHSKAKNRSNIANIARFFNEVMGEKIRHGLLLFGAGVITICCIALFLCACQSEVVETFQQSETLCAVDTEIVFLRGSTIIKSGDNIAIIDAGAEVSQIRETLDEFDAPSINLLVLTGLSEEKTVSLSGLLGDYSVKKIYVPNIGFADTERIGDLLSGREYTLIFSGKTENIGDIEVRFLSPVPGYDFLDDAANSAVVKVSFGDTHFLFLGGANEKTLKSIGEIGRVHLVTLAGNYSPDTKTLENWRAGFFVLAVEPDGEISAELQRSGATVLTTSDVGFDFWVGEVRCAVR